MIIDLFSAGKVLYSEKTLEIFKITSLFNYKFYYILALQHFFGVCFWGLNVLSAACVILLT